MLNAKDVKSGYQKNGVVIDTNLLVVLCVGILDPKLVGLASPKSNFVVDDFMYLKSVSEDSKSVFISPQMLAEVSNLADKWVRKRRYEFYKAIDSLLRGTLEVYKPKEQLLDEKDLPWFGFTDMSIVSICLEKGCVLFTVDAALVEKAKDHGVLAVPYNQEIRTALYFG